MTEAEQASAPKKRTRDPGPLAKAVVALLWVQIAGAAVEAAGSWMVYQAAAGSRLGSSVGAAVAPLSVDEVVALVSLAQLLVLAVGGFLSLKWIYRVSLNAHAIAAGLETRPAWAVGWFFVPFANLLKPFQALREAWQASIRPEGWRKVPTPAIMRWWWGLWLLSNVVGTLASRAIPADGAAPDAYRTAAITLAVSSAIGILNNLAFMQVVRRLTANQRTALARRAFD